VSDAFETTRQWVVDGELSFFRSQVHEGGILNPHDPHGEFHGAVLRNMSWNMDNCAKCHGADFAGGTSGVSCLQCHQQGPTSCTTCHGQPPPTGAHLVHVTGTIGRPADCTECHVKPAKWNDPGHLTTPDGKPKTRGTVTFSDTSLAALAAPARSGPPAWDGASCSNIYCHGAGRGDAKATHTTPAWTGGAAEATCGSCHGVPPPSHDTKYASNAQCSACHPSTSPTPTRLGTTTHVDGKTQVGGVVTPAVPSCTGCHGTPGQNAAPPRDASGNTSTTTLGVGAHQAHVAATHRLSAPIACDVCHLMPAALESPGHIDTPLPAEVTFTGLARNDGAAPVWDRASASCSATYCHGGGASMAADANARLRTPAWTLGTSQAFCGSCHGLPPSTPAHAGKVFPADCIGCHANTVTATGTIIVGSGGSSAHINGVIDVGP